MVRKILGGTLIVLSLSILVLSLIGIGGIWYYKDPLTNGILARLAGVDHELAQAQTALQNAQDELVRALRFVDSAEEALEGFSEQTAVAKEFLDTVTDVLDETIKPSLEVSREKVEEAQKTLDDLRGSIELINKIPFINLEAPDTGLLDSFIEITDSLESEVARVEDIASQASTFLSDTSYLMGGDLQETRDNIQELQTVVDEYGGRIVGWREGLASIMASLPGWVERTALILTVFLGWFAFSQFGLAVHGLAIWRGVNPLGGSESKKG
jgi:hypothetical protein